MVIFFSSSSTASNKLYLFVIFTVLQPADFPAIISDSLSPKNQLESSFIFRSSLARKINSGLGFLQKHNSSGV